MDFTWGSLILIAGLALAIMFFIISVASKNKKPRMRTGIFGIIFGVVAVVGLLSFFMSIPGLDQKVNFTGKALAAGGGGEITCPQGTVLTNGVCVSTSGTSVGTYQPTATYQTKDKYSTTTVSGTSYYKRNGEPASTTAITNTQSGQTYTYWVSNVSYYVAPLNFVAGLTDNIVNSNAYNNGNTTVSLTGYDLTGKVSVTSGVNNISMGANDKADVEFTYLATNKKASFPFGGTFVLEYNSTISDVSCKLDGATLSDAGDFAVTYSTALTAHTSKQFRLPNGFDDGSGTNRVITCKFLNGATAASAGSVYYGKLLDANYYLTNDGNIVLDTEKTLDSDNTRTGFNTITFTGYWAA